ncbi:MAG TPA: hypothetical protein VGD13_01935 [Xanthobacteraceae bacterium]|jgi:hypothetical protein
MIATKEGSPRGGRIVLVGVLLSAVLMPAFASAQTSALQSPTSTTTLPPMDGVYSIPGPGSSLVSPGAALPLAPPPLPPPVTAAPPPAATPLVQAGQVALLLTARFGRDMPQITGGITWRVYSNRPDQGGAFRPLKEEKNAAPLINLPPGNYVVHATFGLASAVKTVQLRSEMVRETFELPAGGLRIEGRVGDIKIPAAHITFDVYKGSQFDYADKSRPAIVRGVASGDVVLVPEGTYHIVSNYGDSNAVVRSDIRVQTGKLTDMTITHRAAMITLKLVGDRGGEALANTDWIVESPAGDIIKESIGAFPRVILAEGDYRAVARNEGKVFTRTFKVITGVDGEVEVLAR